MTFSNFRALLPRLQPSKADKAWPLSQNSRDRRIRTSTALKGQRPKQTNRLHCAVSGLSGGLSRCCYHRAKTFSKPFSSPIFKLNTILATSVWAYTQTHTPVLSHSLSAYFIWAWASAQPSLFASLLFSLSRFERRGAQCFRAAEAPRELKLRGAWNQSPWKTSWHRHRGHRLHISSKLRL